MRLEAPPRELPHLGQAVGGQPGSPVRRQDQASQGGDVEGVLVAHRPRAGRRSDAVAIRCSVGRAAPAARARAMSRRCTSSGPSAIRRVRASAYMPASGSVVARRRRRRAPGWRGRSPSGPSAGPTDLDRRDLGCGRPWRPTSVDHPGGLAGSAAGPGRSPAGTRRSAAGRRPGGPAACRTRAAAAARSAHQLERPLGHADRPHAVVDPAGAEPGLGDGEPAALLAEQVGRRARARRRSVISRVAVLVVRSRTPAAMRSTCTPGVSIGTRTIDCWWCTSASGSVLPMTMRTLQRGSLAPVVHHLRPLMT